MRKFLSGFIVLFAIVFLFVACDKDGDIAGSPHIETPPHAHVFGDWIVTEEATCTEDGIKTRFCACGEKELEIVDARGHVPAGVCEENKIEATCEQEGSYDEVIRCTYCNDVLFEPEHIIIPKLDHTPEEEVQENYIPATCYIDGSFEIVIYCKGCNAEIERTRQSISKLDHTPGEAIEENRVEPSYERDGSYQMVIYCSIKGCGEELERTTYMLDMLVHYPGSVVIENEIPATCTRTGSYDEVVYCTDEQCGHKELSRKTVIVNMTQHINGAIVEENRIEPSCTIDGSYDEVIYCNSDNCRVEISRAKKIIKSTGHTEITDPAVNADCVNNGLTEGSHCVVCNTVIVEQQVIIASHDFVNQICSACGEHEHFIFTLLDDGTYSIKARNIETVPATIIIPSSFNGVTVTQISQSAFANCKKIERLLIPESIKVIDWYAFDECVNLSQIVFNATECTNSYTDNIRSIFCGAGTEGAGIRVTIGANVKRIPAYLFNGENVDSPYEDHFMNVISIDFLEGSVCEEIGFAAFAYCSNLEKIDFPENIIIIDTGAFLNCYSLKSLTIPRTLTGIPHQVFTNCDSLTDVYYGGSREEWENFSIGAWNDPFLSARKHYGSTADEYFEFTLQDDDTYSIRAKDIYNMPEHIILPSVYLEKPITKIEDFAFSAGDNIKSVTIPSSIISIGSYAFSNCTSLENVNLSVGLENIDHHAFSGCLSLTGIIIPNTVYNIGWEAFINCNSITSIKLPESMTSISSGSFMNCYNLSSVMISNSVCVIYGAAFGNCTMLSDVYFNGTELQWNDISVSEGNDALVYATVYYKKDIEPTFNEYFTFTLLEDGTYSIGVKSEYQYNMPSVVVIPSSYNGIPVTAIDEWGFCPDRSGQKGTNNIINILIPDSIKTIGMAAFAYCANLRSLSIPDGVTILDIGILQSCTGLESVYIPKNVTGIYDTVFLQCDNLTNVYYGGSEIDWQDVGIGDWNTPFDNRTVTVYYYSLDVKDLYD